MRGCARGLFDVFGLCTLHDLRFCHHRDHHVDMMGQTVARIAREALRIQLAFNCHQLDQSSPISRQRAIAE